MPLKQRMERIEEQIKRDPQLGGVQWWTRVLDSKNEDAAGAAYFLALNDLIAKPAPTTWEQIKEGWSSDTKEWSDEKLFSLWAYSQVVLGEEQVFEGDFDEEEDKANLCIMAILFWRLFKEAPAPSTAESDQVRQGRLMSGFVRPLLEHAHPEVAQVSSLGLAPWLDQAPICATGAEYLHSLRTFIEPYLRDEEPSG